MRGGVAKFESCEHETEKRGQIKDISIIWTLKYYLRQLHVLFLVNLRTTNSLNRSIKIMLKILFLLDVIKEYWYH